MTNADYTALVLVVDRSGSMQTIAEATEEALREFLNGQKALPGRFTLDTVFFDDQYEERAVLADPKQEEIDLSIHPRGMTALYDAVGRKIDTFGQKLAEMDEKDRPGSILFVIATDGHENTSKEITLPALAARIKKQKDEFGWHFTFIGANQDAVLTAKSFNIGEEHAITFQANQEGTKSVIGSLGAYTTAVRGGVAAAYSPDDRKAAMGDESVGARS